MIPFLFYFLEDEIYSNLTIIVHLLAFFRQLYFVYGDDVIVLYEIQFQKNMITKLYFELLSIK